MQQQLSEVMSQTVPAYYLLTPVCVAAYLAAGSVFSGLLAMALGKDLDNATHATTIVTWPLVLPGAVAYGLLAGVFKGWEAATRHTFVAAARKISGQRPKA